ncbi:MAG: hypothetical protein L3I99_01965 [Sulfurimonas sp.]|nr:hypothetical protein [Sulfurimonas sp.]
MMDTDGLAASGMDKERESVEINVAVNEIVKLLEKGISIDELIAQGVPEELIQLALDEFAQKGQVANQAQPSTQPNSQMAGLAAGRY